MKLLPILLFLMTTFTSCKKENLLADAVMYFPADSAAVWETVAPNQLNWNTDSISSLYTFLEQKHTKSFMILVNGKIAIEAYFNGHTSSSTWPWNSAGKTLVSATTGIAQQNGLLNINNKVSDYLGTGWTNMPLNKENLICVKHLLSMTSGISDTSQFVIKSNLTYMADAGTRWSYSNVFQKLMEVVSAASTQNFETYFNENLKNKIGMQGFWNFGLIYKIYHSNTRSMARFGLLALNNGLWKKEQVIDKNYFNASIQSSQSINPSYGYLWWLNGKTKYMVPGSQMVFTHALVPSAPLDMFAALGASDQKIYVVPSKKMVIVRMGDAADPSHPTFAASGFDNDLWEKINAIIQ